MWAGAAAESAFRRQASTFDEVSAANARRYRKIQNGFVFNLGTASNIYPASCA
jgi:hypothetical protein